MRKTGRGIVLIGLVLTLLYAACAAGEGADWTCPDCGKAGLRTNFCPNCGAERPTTIVCSCGNVVPAGSGYAFCPACGKRLTGEQGADDTPDTYRDPDTPYDIGVPHLGGAAIKRGQMNLTVFWVQTQLKATGIYYQGEKWDETGNLGAETMKEIASFMKARGHGGHKGQIDQTVLDELAAYLGSRLVPVYAGGFYDHMDSIMVGGSTGSMKHIEMSSNATVGARWVQCCLTKIGYFDGTIDGKYGSWTTNAVKSFQHDNGFQQRDNVSLGVARAMLETCYNRGYALDDLP